MRKAVFWNYGQVFIRYGNNIRDAGLSHSRTNWKAWANLHGYVFVDVSGLWPEPWHLRNPVIARQRNTTELVNLTG